MVTSDTVADADLTMLATRSVLFGHQSVGANLLDGIELLAREERRPGLRIREFGATGTDEPSLVHFRVGRNGDPRSKIESFERTLRGLSAAPPDIAGFKFCYTDIGSSTDVEALFRDYRDALDRLGREFPSVLFFHVTVPVERNEAFFRVLVKKALGRATSQDANRARARYNALLVEAYDGAVFDLAAAETEGQRNLERPALSPRYTDDGGHLNAIGKKVIGGRFAAFLAAFAKRAGGSR